MSAVDAPPGMAFAGVAAGEFTSRRGALRLSRLMFVYVLLTSGAIYALVSRAWYMRGIEVLMAAPLMLLGIATLGYAVRRARVRIDVDGLRWGWEPGGFRMGPNRIESVTLYDDAVAVAPRRGSTWYLSARDWDRFDRVPRALKLAGIDYRRARTRAPLAARLQSYGLVLDLLLVGNAIAATAALAFAFSL